MFVTFHHEIASPVVWHSNGSSHAQPSVPVCDGCCFRGCRRCCIIPVSNSVLRRSSKGCAALTGAAGCKAGRLLADVQTSKKGFCRNKKKNLKLLQIIIWEKTIHGQKGKNPKRGLTEVGKFGVSLSSLSKVAKMLSSFAF